MIRASTLSTGSPTAPWDYLYLWYAGTADALVVYTQCGHFCCSPATGKCCACATHATQRYCRICVVGLPT